MAQQSNLSKKMRNGISEMKKYVDLCLKGQDSIPERKVILEKKRDTLVEQMKTLRESIEYIDWKQNFYNDVLSGKTDYYSNLVD